jgi:hypothetical protein
MPPTSCGHQQSQVGAAPGVLYHLWDTSYCLYSWRTLLCYLFSLHATNIMRAPAVTGGESNWCEKHMCDTSYCLHLWRKLLWNLFPVDATNIFRAPASSGGGFLRLFLAEASEALLCNLEAAGLCTVLTRTSGVAYSAFCFLQRLVPASTSSNRQLGTALP